MVKKLDSILVIDVESTCWEGSPPQGQLSEIIEIGLCEVDVATLERKEKQSLFVKPIASEVSEFCTSLTTITPEMLEHAGTLQEAISVLKTKYHAKTRLWASWGDYDRRQFERVCAHFNVGYPFGIGHLNVKTLFSVALGLSRELGMAKAFEHLGWRPEGTHHRGDDDAWNIARLLCFLLQKMRR